MHLIRFDDNFPGLPHVSSIDNEPALDDVGAMTARVFKHTAQVYLVEGTIFHALQ